MKIKNSIEMLNKLFNLYKEGYFEKIIDSELIELTMIFRNFSNSCEFTKNLFIKKNIKISEFSEFCLLTECKVEKILAKEFISGKKTLVENRIKNATPSHICEAKFLEKSSQSILVIGSGAIPLTAIIYYCHTKLPITCIDFDKNSIEIAKNLIQKYFNSDKACSNFNFIQGDACNSSFGKNLIDAALLSSHCIGKKQVLENLYHQSSDTAKLIIRQPKILYSHIYEDININHISHLFTLDNSEVNFDESPVLNKPLTLKKLTK